MKDKLYQCPYERASKCNLKDCCLECETFGEYLNSNTIPYLESRTPEIPSDEAFAKWLEEYAFQVPYDGTKEFYNSEALKHYKAI